MPFIVVPNGNERRWYASLLVGHSNASFGDVRRINEATVYSIYSQNLEKEHPSAANRKSSDYAPYPMI